MQRPFPFSRAQSWPHVTKYARPPSGEIRFPKVSIVIPSFNQGAFIEEALRSVLLQDYPELECLVMDAGSTDQTLSILKRYSARLTFWRSHPDEGQSAAINEGFSRATGEVLGWLCADDLLKPGALRWVSHALQAYSNPAWLIGKTQVHDREGRIKYVRELPPELTPELFQNWTERWFAQSAVFWNRGMWTAVKGLKPQLHYAMDLDLWLRMQQIAAPILFDRIQSITRDHDDRKCTRDEARMLAEYESVIRSAACHP